jgi:hypothetical protein
MGQPDLFRDVIDQALANLEGHTITTEDDKQVVPFRFFELTPAMFIFSPHPAAKRWQDWHATEVFPNIRRREMLNRTRPGPGDDLADI